MRNGEVLVLHSLEISQQLFCGFIFDPDLCPKKQKQKNKHPKPNVNVVHTGEQPQL